MLFYLFSFCSSIPRKPVPIPVEYFSLETYRERREARDKSVVYIIYQTNTTVGEKGDLTDLFQYGAELSAAFVREGIYYAICLDKKVKYSRVVCYHSDVPEGFFRVHPWMIPAQVATKIIHLASRTLKQYKREMKEQKNPGIGRLKNELRNINKLLKTTPDEESRKTLIQTKNDLINEFLEAIPEEKREIRRLKLKNKEIVDKEERRKANEIVHQMKKALNQENNSENEEKRDKNSLHKKIKKNLKVFRAMWKESHREESEYNVEEELEKLKFQRKQNEERLEDDSEEVEQLYNIMKTVKSMAGPDEKFDPEIEQRYEFMTKMREKRHSRQKKEGNYRPRDEFGEYLYDDPDIRTGVDDVQNVGIEEIDTSPIKNAKEEEERKKKEISKDKFPPEIPQEPIAGQYDGL